MLTIYTRQGQTLNSASLEPNAAFPDHPLWIDVYAPTPEEEARLQDELKIDIPTGEEIWKNDVLNRLHSEDDVSYMYASIITKLDTPYPKTSPITFILSPKYLVTIRNINPTSFKNFSSRILRSPQNFLNGPDVLEGLMEDVITRVAHNSEVVVQELDALSHKIFGSESSSDFQKNPSSVMKDTLRSLGACADLNSQINESLHSISRLLSFFRETSGISEKLKAKINILITDSKALTEQSAFLSDKVTFQLDATLGMINVEQNMIIKIFSVVAVFFLPPTLVSSIYGMNFRHMPELDWEIGYPVAIIIMLLCAIGPFIFFRKRGWL
jgi:magnesium transporter